jgi:DNA ligase D
MAASKPEEVRDGVALTNLDQPLFDGADATKRDLVDYLDGIADRLVPVLRNRPLSVIRVHRGEDAFMQKNLPKHAPDWIPTVKYWAETSKRDVAYALCNDKPTLLWFANQRAVEYHPTLMTVNPDVVTHIVLDLDPPPERGFPAAVAAAHAVRATLDEVGLSGAIKTSGAKGIHIFVPVVPETTWHDAAAVTRAIAERTAQRAPDICTTAFMKDDRGDRVFVDSTRAGGATVVAAYSPRVRPGAPVSWPFDWSELDSIVPTDHTIRNAVEQLAGADPWSSLMPDPQALPADLVAEGNAMPNDRVEAMHEGKRRKRAKESD